MGYFVRPPDTGNCWDILRNLDAISLHLGIHTEYRMLDGHPTYPEPGF